MTDGAREQRAADLIRRAGAANAVVLFFYFIASPFLAAVAPFYPSGWQPAIEGAGRVISALSPPEPLMSWIYGESPLNSPGAFAASYLLLAGSATLCWAAAMIFLHRYRDAVTPALAASVFRWSIAFALVLVFATPVVVHDFWLSVGWGRLVAEGSNPYYVPIPPGDLPFREPVELMTYGPLWAVLSGLAAVIAGGNLLGTAALQKLFIAGAWVGCCATVRLLMRDRPPAAQALAITAFGWAPIGLLHGIADGHTDPVMAFPMLLWLLLVERARPYGGAMALAGSVAIKYVTAPLLALHVLRGILHRDDRSPWVKSAVLCVVVAGASIAIFYRSPEFFSSATQMKSWRFFTPTAVMDGALQRVGGAPSWFAVTIDALLAGMMLTLVIARVREKTVSGFRAAVLWTMLGLLTCAVGHVWPWFLIWVLPLAAIQLDRRGAWLVIGMTAVSPFILLPWTVLPELGASLRLGVPGIVLYLAGVSALLAGRRTRVAIGSAGNG